ncbi:hypothetical protein TYRP_015438, partial [Tyrophagus putrescentiae]
MKIVPFSLVLTVVLGKPLSFADAQHAQPNKSVGAAFAEAEKIQFHLCFVFALGLFLILSRAFIPDQLLVPDRDNELVLDLVSDLAPRQDSDLANDLVPNLANDLAPDLVSDLAPDQDNDLVNDLAPYRDNDLIPNR